MSKVAFASYDVQTLRGRAGGVGNFVTQFARMLREQGEEVSIIVTRAETQGFPIDRPWREKYHAWGIELLEIHNTAATPNRWPDVWAMRLSEQLAPVLPSYDVVYFMDWANTAFHTVRAKRFTTARMPHCVTVLHGPSSWVRWGDRKYPQIPSDLNLGFLERYSARNSDTVVAPSRYILEWALRNGWQFRRQPEILGLPFRPEGPERPRQAARKLTRLLFFGRLEARKGYDLFVKALKYLAAGSLDIIRGLREIVLLGHEDVPDAADWVRRELAETKVPVTHLGSLDSFQARDYLADRVADTLVVVPSPYENFPYAVIETSLITGLNVICTRGGGAPEIFRGQGDAQMFDPLPSALAAKLVERLSQPLAPEQLVQYDFMAANIRWLAFHRRICDEAASSKPVRSSACTSPAVDVCVTYYNKARHFPQLCESLERQTTRDFRVIAIDDGSPDTEAQAVFDAMAQRYRGRGWVFVRQANRFIDAARNEAARLAQAEYLLMVDGDDVLVPNAVERLLEAARLSGDDCLVPASYMFAGDEFPYNRETGAIKAPPFALYMPLGASTMAGLFDPSVFGGSVVLIKRAAFQAIGGYREMRGAAHEDWELHARLALSGYKTDVVPEYLHLYRQTDDGFSHHADDLLAKRRMIETYDHHFAAHGLPDGAAAIYGLYYQSNEWKIPNNLVDLQRYAPDGDGPPMVATIRRAYRRTVPLEIRLRIGARIEKFWGRTPPP